MKGLSVILLARAAADAADISAINNKDTINNNIDTSYNSRFQRALRWNWSFFNNNNNNGNDDIQETTSNIDDDLTMTNGDIVEEIPWAGGFVLGDTDPPTNRPTKPPTKVSLNDYMEVACLLNLSYITQN